MLTLYLSPGSSSMAPHIALHEIGVEFESRWVSFAQARTIHAEYLALNPKAKCRPCSSTGVHRCRSGGGPLLPRQALPASGSFPGRRPRSGGPDHLVDVLHRLDGPPGTPGLASSGGKRCSKSPNHRLRQIRRARVTVEAMKDIHEMIWPSASRSWPGKTACGKRLARLEDRRHFGQRWTPVDEQGRHFAFRGSAPGIRACIVRAWRNETHRLSNSDTDFVQCDVRRHRARPGDK